jgi:hypothetical protein
MKILILSIFLAFSSTCIYAQNTVQKSKKQLKAEKKAQQIKEIRDIVTSKNFIFKAESVNQVNAGTKKLTSDFGIEVRNDSIFSYMPYYGNAYSRDYTSFKNSPMGFIQPMESYRQIRRKSGYAIDIKVKNQHDVIDLTFHISKTGITSVSASSINRQNITYTGEILIPQPKFVESEQN